MRSGRRWAEQAVLRTETPMPDNAFGSSVELDAYTAVVSAENAYYAGMNAAGEVDVYVRSGASRPRQGVLQASDAASLQRFGVSVALSGDVVLVGARRKTHSGLPLAGAAYVYARISGLWFEQSIRYASDASANDEFGNRVSVDGQTALVGAVRKNGLAGAAYVYRLASETDAGPGDAGPEGGNDAAADAAPDAVDAAPDAVDAAPDAIDAAPDAADAEADAAPEADAMAEAGPDGEAGPDAEAGADAEADAADAAAEAEPGHADAAAEADAGAEPTPTSNGCSCKLPGGQQKPVPWTALVLGLGIAALLRRRRLDVT